MGVWLLHAPPALTFRDELGAIVVWDGSAGFEIFDYPGLYAALVNFIPSIDIIID
jgi:hypothetical protein